MPSSGLTRLAAWLLLVLTALPPVHLVFPDGGCRVPAEASPCGIEAACASIAPSEGAGAILIPPGGAPPSIRADRTHSLLDCRLCRELLRVAATTSPRAPTPIALLPAAPTHLVSLERPASADAPHLWAPRAPPAPSC